MDSGRAFCIEVAPRADVSVTGRDEFSWKPNASPDQLSASQRLLSRSAQISAHCCVVVAINKLVRDARVRVPQRSKFGGWLTAGADCVHRKYTKVECVLQAASNIDNWVAGIFYSREAVECHN
jgi:hypothetical protein